MITDIEIFQNLKKTIDIYFAISQTTFEEFKQFCKIKVLEKGDIFTFLGQIPKSFGYIYSGLMRAYIVDENGTEYNKIFFYEHTFPGSMVALLMGTESTFAIEALEKTTVIEVNQRAYRKLLLEKDDLKIFHINYLEKNWVIEKEKREVSLVQETASVRYLNFCKQYPDLERRIADYHIASHIGVSPTQLSRIKKSLKKNNLSTYVNDKN